jgi:iron complex outermembrane receptor protein
LSVRLSYNKRSSYPEGGFANNGVPCCGPTFTLQGLAHPSPRLDLSTNYTINDNFSIFADWTNIFPHPFHSDIVRDNYNLAQGTLTSREVFPMVVRFEETVLSGGIRFNFGGREHAAAPPPYIAPPAPLAPPPPAVVPAPPPPPPPATVPERG